MNASRTPSLSQEGAATAKRAPLYVAGNAAVVLLCGFVILGAGFFGLASCGGYIWHKQLFFGLAVSLGVTALLVPSSLLPSAGVKGVFAAGLLVAFVLVESAVAPFYPGPPESLSEYLSLFMQAIWYGPCV